MDFRRLRSMKNRKVFSKIFAVFISAVLVTTTCFVYDIVIYAMETAQSEAVTDGESVDAVSAPATVDTAQSIRAEKMMRSLARGEFEVFDFPLNAEDEMLPCVFDSRSAARVSSVLLMADGTAGSDEEAAIPVSGDASEQDKVDEEVSQITYKTVVETEVVACTSTEVPIIYSAFSGRYTNSTARDGEKEITKRQKYVDGKLVEEVVVSEKTTVKPVNGIKYVDKTGSLIDYGSGAPTEYVEKLDIKFTAYTYGEVGGSYTATGHNTQVGYVAVDKNLIPLYSKLYIVLDNGFVYGYCYAMDTGGGIKGNRIDVFLPSVADMKDFGVRTGTCYVIRRGK